MFPYIEQPQLTIGSYTLYAFQVMVCIAVILGYEITVRRAPKLGLDSEETGSLIAWVILWGFIACHVFDVVAYYPEQVLENPLILLKFWGSMSSFGGILGGLLAMILLTRKRGMSGIDALRLIDGAGFAFPFAWIFGRAGCAMAHDHMGIHSDHWLAVQFPDGPRFDLGLLEFLYTVPLAALFFLLDRRPRPPGFFLGLFFTLYGPIRFAMDMLRTGDARYFGWTPGQYLSILVTVGGIGLLAWVLTRGRSEDTA